MANQRILQGTAATLTFHNLDADGVPADTAGSVTVGVLHGDGTTAITSGTATTHGAASSGLYSVALPASQTSKTDLLTATWLDVASGQSFVTYHEVVGAYIFSMDDVRAFPTLGSTSTYTNSVIIAKRAEVEDELEQIRNVAFVPRYARLVLDGNGNTEIVTGLTYLRSLRSAKILQSTGSSLSTAFTATQIAACEITFDGRIRRGDGGIWDYGVQNIVVEVEHGFTDWGADLRIACLTRLREKLNWPITAIPDRATAFSSPDGYSYNLNPMKADGNSTGNPYIDAVYARYPTNTPGDLPAGRTLTFQPQYGGVFRGSPINR
jgi:hypothetical protein